MTVEIKESRLSYSQFKSRGKSGKDEDETILLGQEAKSPQEPSLANWETVRAPLLALTTFLLTTQSIMPTLTS